LLTARGPAVTLEGHFFDPDRGVLSFTGDTAEAVLLELEAQRRAGRGGAGAAAPSSRAARNRPAARLGSDRGGRGDLGGDSRRRSGSMPLLEESDRGAVRAGELAAELRALGGRRWSCAAR
jgi:hypothetical protein